MSYDIDVTDIVVPQITRHGRIPRCGVRRERRTSSRQKGENLAPSCAGVSPAPRVESEAGGGKKRKNF